MIPTMEEAQRLLEAYNQDEFHLKHAKIVSGVMGYFANEYDPETWNSGKSSACCTIWILKNIRRNIASKSRRL